MKGSNKYKKKDADLIQFYFHSFVTSNSAYFNGGKVLGGSVSTLDIGIISTSNWSQLTGVLPTADAGQIRVITKTGHLQGNRFCFYPGATLRHQLISAPNIHTVSSNQLQSGHLLLPHGPSWIHMHCHGAKIGQNKAYSTTDKETQMRLCIWRLWERFIRKSNGCISLWVCSSGCSKVAAALI